MARKKKILMTVEKTDTGFSAFSEDQGIFTTGLSIPELINNAYEASAFYFEDQKHQPDDVKTVIKLNPGITKWNLSALVG